MGAELDKLSDEELQRRTLKLLFTPASPPSTSCELFVR